MHTKKPLWVERFWRRPLKEQVTSDAWVLRDGDPANGLCGGLLVGQAYRPDHPLLHTGLGGHFLRTYRCL